jgi:hypothetical protein
MRKLNHLICFTGKCLSTQYPVAEVLDESYSRLTPRSGVAVQARQSIKLPLLILLSLFTADWGVKVESGIGLPNAHRKCVGVDIS